MQLKSQKKSRVELNRSQSSCYEIVRFPCLLFLSREESLLWEQTESRACLLSDQWVAREFWKCRSLANRQAADERPRWALFFFPNLFCVYFSDVIIWESFCVNQRRRTWLVGTALMTKRKLSIGYERVDDVLLLLLSPTTTKLLSSRCWLQSLPFYSYSPLL